RTQPGLLGLVQRHSAGDRREGTPTTIRGEAGELLDATGRLGLAPSPDGARRERGGEPVGATVQQCVQDGRALRGVLPQAVERGGEVTAVVDQAGDLEEISLDLLEDALGLRLLQEGGDSQQLEGI